MAKSYGGVARVSRSDTGEGVGCICCVGIERGEYDMARPHVSIPPHTVHSLRALRVGFDREREWCGLFANVVVNVLLC